MIKQQRFFWILLLLLPLLGVFSGCKKFLDRKPLGTATEGDLSQGGVEGKVFGLYGGLVNTDGLTNFQMLWFKGIRSDDAQKGSIPGDLADAGQAMDRFQYTKDHWLLNGYWDGHYSFINATNDVLHDIDSLKLTDPGSIVNSAEARFFRAYTYFDLVRDYGSVPIITKKVNNPGDLNVAKSSVAEVYAFIEADLQFAAATLPVTWANNQFPGRLTKGAANALLAKVLLYQEKWAASLARSEEVINSGQYALYPKYAKFFKEEGENSSESILEAQMYVNSNGATVVGNNHNETQGVRGSGDWDLGWGFHTPTEDLEKAYESGDPRRQATILYTGQSDGGDAAGGYGRTLPSGLAQPYWNKKVYPDPARRNAITAGGRQGYWMNIRLLRYADVLLMAAEAANEIGGTANTTKALTWLETVRARARDGNNTVLPAVTATGQAEVRRAIQHERRVEFGMEFERFYDLVRWRLAESVLGPLGYQPRNRYYPIPQPVLDRFNKVTQNPDWQ